MKKLKNFVSGFLAIALLCLASMTCFATDASSQTVTGPTPTFIKMCNNLFNNPTEYRALDNSQNDVTEMFISRHASDYQSNDYNALWDAFGNELYAITWENEKKINTRGRIAQRTAEKSFYVTDGTTETIPEVAFEMLYTISGDYSFDEATKQIVDYSDARLTIDSFHGGACFDYHVFDETTNATVTSGNNRVNFRATFSINVEYDIPVGVFPVKGNVDFGPYSGSVTGYAQ